MLVDFTDVLSYGEEKGYSWNDLCDRLDFLNPTDGDGTQDWYVSEFNIDNNNYTDDKEMIQLILDFCIDNKIKKEFTITA